MIIRSNGITIDTENYENIWYSVQLRRSGEWDYGSDDYETAVKMLHKQGHGLIAVISDGENPVCLAEIFYSDLFDDEVTLYIPWDNCEGFQCVDYGQAKEIYEAWYGEARYSNMWYPDFYDVWREADEDDIDAYGVYGVA